MTDNASDTPIDERDTADQGDAPVQADVIDPTEHPPTAPTPELLGLTLPDDADDAIALLMRELHEARAESGDLLDNVQRIAADFDNYRKRIDRDKVENVQRAGQRVIVSLLPALDSLDAALAIEATTETEERMLDGMEGTRALLLEALGREGCEQINSIGQPFDPALHEAVSVLPGEGDQIVEQELRKGYTMQGRVIRPALVTVGHA